MISVLQDDEVLLGGLSQPVYKYCLIRSKMLPSPASEYVHVWSSFETSLCHPQLRRHITELRDIR